MLSAGICSLFSLTPLWRMTRISWKPNFCSIKLQLRIEWENKRRRYEQTHAHTTSIFSIRHSKLLLITLHAHYLCMICYVCSVVFFFFCCIIFICSAFFFTNIVKVFVGRARHRFRFRILSQNQARPSLVDVTQE